MTVTRRTFLTMAAAMAASCSLPVPSPAGALPRRESVQIVWGTGVFRGLAVPAPGLPAQQLQKVLEALEADTSNPSGPQQGGYQLQMRFLQPPPAMRAEEWLKEISTDLATVTTDDLGRLVEAGVLIPLDRFLRTDRSFHLDEYYASVTDQFRVQDTLYALPANGFPHMLYYDPWAFSGAHRPFPDHNWTWQNLVAAAQALTERSDRGEVLRWGLSISPLGLLTLLWQNEADLLDPVSVRCRLQEAGAIEALAFCRDLFHTYRVSPPFRGNDLVSLLNRPTKIALVYDRTASMPPAIFYQGHGGRYLVAELPRSKQRATMVSAGMGIAITTHAKEPEVAYTALKGLISALQSNVYVPVHKPAIARMHTFLPGWNAAEIEAVQRAMAYARSAPTFSKDLLTLGTRYRIADDLLRGEAVPTVVNRACALIDEYRRTGQAPGV